MLQPRPYLHPLRFLFDDIDCGDIQVPLWHRGFLYGECDVIGLFDSLNLGCPIGSLTFWQPGENAQGSPIGINPKTRGARLHVIDGLQRLATLYSAMQGKPLQLPNGEQFNLRVAFRVHDGEFRISDSVIARDPDYISDISVLWSPKPVLLEITDQFLDRLRAHRQVTPAEAKELALAIAHVEGFAERQIPIEECCTFYPVNTAVAIYERLNKLW